MSEHIIGEIAGKIWHYLNEHGASTVTQIATNTGIARNDIHRGVGWLLKEDKLFIEIKKRIEIISIK